VLHIDAFSGIAGNMFVGALLDAGLSRRALSADLAGLGLDHRLRVSRVRRGALSGCYVDVRVPVAGRKTKAGQKSAASGKRAARRTSVSGGDHHGAAPGTAHSHAAHGERSHSQIRRILEGAKLVPEVRDRALQVFEELARAEARVHGTKLEEVHFHEVGAVDAIVDIAASAIGIHRLGVEYVSCTPVALGHGSVETAHGILPLPAPATLDGFAFVPSGFETTGTSR
jgi:hypothetical protein